VLDLAGSRYFEAEGIFAQEVVPRTRAAGLLAAAYCVRQHSTVTFWRRLTRDLREHRKPPLVLVRRGLALMRDQKRVVEHAVALGCEPVFPDEAYAAVRRMVSHRSADA
jgi:uridine kinase